MYLCRANLEHNRSTYIFFQYLGPLFDWLMCSMCAGDVILTGTPFGVGFTRDPPLFLKDGDVITCAVDGVGAITNTVMGPP